jgi:hypothetical protein
LRAKTVETEVARLAGELHAKFGTHAPNHAAFVLNRPFVHRYDQQKAIWDIELTTEPRTEFRYVYDKTSSCTAFKHDASHPIELLPRCFAPFD